MSEEAVAISAETSTPIEVSTVGGNTPATETSSTSTVGKSIGKTGSSGTENTPEAVPMPTYTPNYKFKYHDATKNQDVEHEFEEWARPFIKQKEIEDKFRDLYSKAHGIEYVRNSRDTFKKEAETHKGELTNLQKSLSKLSSYVQKDDLGTFFSSLRIPEEKILKYALDRVNYHQLPPEKRAEYDQALDTRTRAAVLAEENQRLQQENLHTQVMLRDQELRQVLTSPEVSSVADTYDSRMGTPGAFRDQCIKRGSYYFQVHQKDVPAHEIAREVAQEIQKLIGSPAVIPVATPGAPSGQEMQTPNEKKPVIPNIQGRGTSPAKKLNTSIEGLKQLRRERT